MNPTLFRIKICGITNVADAQLAADAGADAIGLNFYAPSPRHIADSVAAEIIASLPKWVARVGVFVNFSADEVGRVADQLQLDWIQLHGDEPPDFISRLAPRRVIRALSCGAGEIAHVHQYLAQCRTIGAMPAAVLVDASVRSAYGGTGKTADWTALAPPRDELLGLPLILAGGLTPDNVAAAVGTVRPAAVDTASGVESSPGKKDPELVRRFVSLAGRALSTKPVSG
jgi:phosphoribosylanthranilate isomerase